MSRETLPVELRFWEKVDIRGDDECWPWLAATRRKDQGYGAFWLDGRHQPASRVALILSGTAITPEEEACHTCDTPSCCNPRHLFPGTGKENAEDKVAKGRHVHGVMVHTAKLTEEDVRFIRAQRPPGMRALPRGAAAALLKRFPIGATHLSDILARRTWKDVA